jgi:phosphopantetheinyl transferase (holo-ACP synthase)
MGSDGEIGEVAHGIGFHDTLPATRPSLPCVQIVEAADGPTRHARLQDFAAHLLGRLEVVIHHAPGRRPRVVAPLGSGLVLSSASRGAMAAFGAASSPIGVDVEAVGEAAAIPWLVLHPGERAALEAAADPAWAFARLWSLKEAYLKAIGSGLDRDPAQFEVRLGEQMAARIVDPDQPRPILAAATVWRTLADTRYAISAVLLPA